MNDMTNGPLPEMSEGQAREWQAILASYKSKSLLTGDIAGVDAVRMPVYDPQTGRTARNMCCVLWQALRRILSLPA